MRPFVFALFAEIFVSPPNGARARKEPLPKNSDHSFFIIHYSFFIKQKPPFGGFCGCGIDSCGSPAEKKLVETRRKGTRTLTV